jgi:hypothetical protein
MDSVKRVLECQGMAMDDLMPVQVDCTDLSVYDTFQWCLLKLTSTSSSLLAFSLGSRASSAVRTSN